MVISGISNTYILFLVTVLLRYTYFLQYREKVRLYEAKIIGLIHT